MRKRHWLRAAAVIAGTLLVLTACGDSDDEATTTTAAEEEGEITTVRLSEWEVVPDVAAAASGPVTFDAENVGDEVHELVVIKADGFDSLPLDADGAVDEAQLGDTLIGEIEEFPAGTSADGTFDLEPGSYVLICNITETEPDGTIESHYALGMRVEFAAEEAE
jgi:hypothetical protein